MALENAFGSLNLEVTQTEGVGAINAIEDVLRQILARLPFVDQVNSAGRVNVVAGTLPTVTTVGTVSAITGGTITTVGSVTAVANIVAVGGQAASYDQYAAMQQGASALRSRITVT